MKYAIILHNMIVEARRDGYNNELYELNFVASQKGFFLDKNGLEKAYNWNKNETILQEVSNVAQSDRWAKHISMFDNQMKDEVTHFPLKRDFINQI